MKSELVTQLSTIGAAVALCLVFAGCEKEAAPTSTYTGKVVLHDEFGHPLNDNSGVTVSLYEETSVKTSTAIDGSFSLSGIPMGKYTLKVEKEIPPVYYGTYYTKITVSNPTGTITKPINLGQITNIATAQYDWTYTLDLAKGYVIFRGTRIPSAGTDTRMRAHRLFFNFSVSDVYPNLYTSHYSIGPIQNNQATGFSDTISLSKLRAANIGTAPEVAIASDNPKADSCIVPAVDYDFNGKPIYSNSFRNSYPAIGLPAHAYAGQLFTSVKLN
jgi:hypothetical protein